MENMIISAVDVDLSKNVLMLALAGSESRIYQVSITLNSERLAKVFGTNALSGLNGRAVRGIIEDGRVINLCHIIEDYFLIPQSEAAECEQNIKNEP